jgi:hypothetical protein
LTNVPKSSPVETGRQDIAVDIYDSPDWQKEIMPNLLHIQEIKGEIVPTQAPNSQR